MSRWIGSANWLCCVKRHCIPTPLNGKHGMLYISNFMGCLCMHYHLIISVCVLQSMTVTHPATIKWSWAMRTSSPQALILTPLLLQMMKVMMMMTMIFPGWGMWQTASSNLEPKTRSCHLDFEILPHERFSCFPNKNKTTGNLSLLAVLKQFCLCRRITMPSWSKPGKPKFSLQLEEDSVMRLRGSLGWIRLKELYS